MHTIRPFMIQVGYTEIITECLLNDSKRLLDFYIWMLKPIHLNTFWMNSSIFLTSPATVVVNKI